MLAYVPTIGESETATYYNNWLDADVSVRQVQTGEYPLPAKSFYVKKMEKVIVGAVSN